MLQSIPALPVGDIKKSIGFYCDKLGFTLVHHEDGFSIIAMWNWERKNYFIKE